MSERPWLLVSAAEAHLLTDGASAVAAYRGVASLKIRGNHVPAGISVANHDARTPGRFAIRARGLLAFGVLNAFAEGYYGMSGAEDVLKEWLEGSPFDDYFIPGLVLFVVVGGSFLAALSDVSGARWAVVLKRGHTGRLRQQW